jgi:precorrin-6Y C5,15-methyltransferase (decarboxylating)
MSAWLAILGINEDGVEGLGATARQRLAAAALVVGGARHLALAAPLINGESLAWPSPMSAAYPAILARRGEPVVVLASGDPSHYGIGSALAALLPGEDILCLPQPSAVSLACARLGWPLAEVAVVSACGRPRAARRGARRLCR